MKLMLAILVMTTTVSGWSRSEHIISIKERLRYELWYSGITEKKKPILVKKQPQLPEELSRPLRNL